MPRTHILKISRLEALTDGIFAIAMTILVLNLSLPDHIAVSSLSAFLMNDIVLKLFVYIGSFIILGTLWIGMHFQFGLLDHVNRPYLWAHVLYLMITCIVPFSANLIAIYPNNILTLSFYATNLLAASLSQILISQVAHFYKLNNHYYNTAIRRAVIGRILLAPVFYLGAILVAFWNTSWAFVFLIAPILIYIIPGKVDHFDR